VDQVLLFAFMKDGKKKYGLCAVTVDDVFENLRKSILAILKNDGFCVECRLDANLPPVLGNRQALVRCVQNLIENAAKYSGDSRWIGISAEVDEVDSKERGVKIIVADRGGGIAQSDLPNIFEPFYRSPAAVSAQIHGNGLGLSVVMHIVNEMRGTISVTSELGKGSVFTLHLRKA
jgi:signal transduction histidine kinase